MNKIAITHVSKQYVIKNRPFVALNDISLNVEEGSFTVLSGPSGSGKSTILQLVSGLEQPTKGQIIINGQNITNMSNRQLSAFRRKNIGIIFQQFYLDPMLTLRQNIELPSMFFGTKPAERKKRTLELANFMGLNEHLDHLPSELSGGQVQRAAVARAIYNKPDILIADESTSSLDIENITAIIKLFKQIQSVYGTTLLIATHDQNVSHFADYTIKINNGTILS